MFCIFCGSTERTSLGKEFLMDIISSGVNSSSSSLPSSFETTFAKSAASISGELTEDEFWVVVKRTINGSTKRYVECFSNFDFDETDATDFRFLDSHLSYSGSATTTLSGLSHLE